MLQSKVPASEEMGELQSYSAVSHEVPVNPDCRVFRGRGRVRKESGFLSFDDSGDRFLQESVSGKRFVSTDLPGDAERYFRKTEEGCRFFLQPSSILYAEQPV